MISNKGITIVALIITVVIMLILAGVGIYYGSDAIDKARLEDIRTDMISIKTKAKIVAEQYNFKDIDNLVGIPVYTEDRNIQDNIIQALPDELKNIFSGLENKENIYFWSQEDLNNEGLNAIKINAEEFYIIYYNLEDTNATEVYYSKGFDGAYSLTDLQNK